MSRLGKWRWLLSALLTVGAALFAVGVAAERNAAAGHQEPVAATHVEGATAEGAPHAEGGTAEGATATGEAAEAPATSETSETPHTEASGETVLGVDLESPLLLALGVAVSLGLAFLAWRFNTRLLLLVIVGFTLAFAVFDIAEVRHQVNESRTGLAVLAAVIAAVHLAGAAAAQQRTWLASDAQGKSVQVR
jgi:hypothetical protein